jgi:hypothetical protein
METTCLISVCCFDWAAIDKKRVRAGDYVAFWEWGCGWGSPAVTHYSVWLRKIKCVLLVGPTKIRYWTAGFEKQHFAASRGGKETSTVEHVNNGAMLHCALFTKWTVFFPEKLVQLINCTCIFHVNVNNIFFKKKISLRWIKFTCTIISILFMIIFYLILLHAG